MSGARTASAGAAELLGAGGPFAERLPGFRERPGQQGLAAAVEAACRPGGLLVAEAGTGVGKTFAYLVPALSRGLRTVISTGTRNLQDQLFHRDLPELQRVLGTHRTTALLKGRSNYLCLYRLERALGDGGTPLAELPRLTALRRWSETTRSGDLGEYADAAALEPLAARVTSTAENCLGQECPRFSDCFLLRARQRAQRADVVVVNHHLLFADMALRREGFGELLPDAELVIVDEAHRLPETATRFFGRDLSQRMLLELGRDVRAEALEVEGALGSVAEACDALELAVRRLRLALEPLPARGAWSEAGTLPELGALGSALAALGERLEPLLSASRGLEQCGRRAAEQCDRLRAFAGEPEDAVAWYERSSRGFVLHLSPLDVAADMRAYRERTDASWVFTSATLAADRGFELFCRRLGLEEAECARFPSPFAFAERAGLYLPPGLPEPGARDFVDRLLAAVLPVLALTDGHAFFLFTSHRNLRYAAARLRNLDRWPLLVQGEAPRAQLLDSFRQTPRAVLLGAASFWEGVDVAGEALRCVLLDKLPFAAPDDPVLEARLRRIRDQGGDPFREEQLPQAVLALKQGVGRLIRRESDYGVVVIGDPRLTRRGYGRVFLRSLPPLKPLGSLAEVERFLAAFGQSTNGNVRQHS